MLDDTTPPCFGRYLRYAIESNFKYFQLLDRGARKLSLIVGLTRAGNDRMDFALALRQASGNTVEVEVGPFAPDLKPFFITLRCDIDAVVPAAVWKDAVYKAWNEFVAQVELSLPVTPRHRLINDQRILNLARARSQSAVLVGLIDDGCPFAAAQFRNASGASRVLALWDQNQEGMDPIDIGSGPKRFGELVTDFNYGLEFWSNHPTPPDPHQIGIDDWIALHKTPAGTTDEDRCYERSLRKSLFGEVAHGAHVMDVLAGNMPPSSRVSLDRESPQTWATLPGIDPASAADIVFVQITEAAVKDATGRWLDTYLLDGVRYILSCAGKLTKRVVVNISYGPTTGPHDGTAELEGALLELVQQYDQTVYNLDGTVKSPKLDIVLAAGNAYQSEGHVTFESSAMLTSAEWIWRIPPDNTVPCFAEIWVETGPGSSANVSLTPPAYSTGSSANIQTMPLGNNTVWLFTVPPTIAQPPGTSGAAHGDWKFSISGLPAGIRVHAYAARTDPNMGARTGARSSCFLDPAWERDHSASASQCRSHGEFDKSGSLIQRGGTLNGIATGRHPGLHVAAGYRLADACQAPYSSAGPARRPGGRGGPDFALLGDESYALAGVRAGATRSGGTFRMVGTSTAAPQLARRIANGPGWDTSLPPPVLNPGGVVETAKRGTGNLAPP